MVAPCMKHVGLVRENESFLSVILKSLFLLKETLAPLLKQAWTVSGVLLSMVGHGMLLGYPSSLLPALQAADSPIPVDLDTSSWIASSVALAGIPAFLISSALMDQYGRKTAHVILIVPGIIGWLMIYFSSNVPVLLFGRILGGITSAAAVALGAVVIGEYTSPKHRGMFLNLKTAAVCLGSMAVHILGHYLNWRTVAIYALVPNLIAFGIICTWPESPAWLASRQKYERSEKSFFWLRGISDASKKEFEEFISAQKASHRDKEKTILEVLLYFFKKFTRKDFIKPVLIVTFGSLLIEASGRHIFPAYALTIISEVTGNEAQSYYYTLAIDVIITCSATFSSVLVRIMKRRTLLFVSGFATVAVLMVVCSYLFLVSKGILSNDYPLLPIGLFVVYFILANLGCSPIPLALLGEVYPLVHRGSGSAVSGFLMSFFLMLGLQVTPYLLNSIKVYGTFFVLGVLMVLALLALFFLLPETKDRTLQEIEDYFNYGEFRSRQDKDAKRKQDEDEKAKMMNVA